MTNLLRLTYISRAVGTLHEGELDLLLREARATNKELGVTGLLCSGRGYYLQALKDRKRTSWPSTPESSATGDT